jgi:hypothetical protein
VHLAPFGDSRCIVDGVQCVFIFHIGRNIITSRIWDAFYFRKFFADEFIEKCRFAGIGFSYDCDRNSFLALFGKSTPNPSFPHCRGHVKEGDSLLGHCLQFFLQEIDISSSLGADTDDVFESEIIIIAHGEVSFILSVFYINLIDHENGLILFVLVHDVS